MQWIYNVHFFHWSHDIFIKFVIKFFERVLIKREHIYLIKQFKICNFKVKRLLFNGGFYLRGNSVNRSLLMNVCNWWESCRANTPCTIITVISINVFSLSLQIMQGANYPADQTNPMVNIRIATSSMHFKPCYCNV